MSKELTFEESLKRLEDIIEQLESKDGVDLEKSIELYQEGMVLSARVNTLLGQAEEKIAVLNEQNGTVQRKEITESELRD